MTGTWTPRTPQPPSPAATRAARTPRPISTRAPAHEDADDPDVDPEMMNPRAPIEADADRHDDPDADPDRLAPRGR